MNRTASKPHSILKTIDKVGRIKLVGRLGITEAVIIAAVIFVVARYFN